MKIGIYPGSFDPITYGHIDIIERATKLADEVIVAVLNNTEKNCLFSVEERVKMIKDAISSFENVKVDSFGGLLVDYAKFQNASMIIRGLRAVTDFEYELQLAQTNRELCSSVDTVFLLTNIQYSYLSSSIVKQVAKENGDISKFVTPLTIKMLNEKYKGTSDVHKKF